MFFRYLLCVVLLIFLASDTNAFVYAKTCRSAFLASQASASYWSKWVPTAHLPRPAPWHSYSPSELRGAHLRYAATRRRWESPSPSFKPPIRLLPPHGPNVPPQRWRLIRGTHWAWSLRHLTGEVSFCDLRSGLVVGKWSAGGSVIDAYVESRSPHEYVLCYRKTKQGDDTSDFEIVATSVTFEQENLVSPIKLSFRTTHRAPVKKGFFLSSRFPRTPMVLWRDYWIGSYFRVKPWAGGLFLWSMSENHIFYFEMGVPQCIKFVDDVVFTTLDISNSAHWNDAFRCIHIPSLVISAQLPDGSLSLTENAFTVLSPTCVMEPPTAGSLFPVYAKIYSIPTCSPPHTGYCFIRPLGVEWEVLEAEIDLSTPGPIKNFRRVSRQYTVQRPTYLFHDSDDDLLLCLPLGRRGQLCASPSVRFLRVGKPDKWRVARLGGFDKMRLSGLSVNRDAGYVIIWATKDWPHSTLDHGFICWLDERNAGDMIFSRTKELISSWGRGLLRRFW